MNRDRRDHMKRKRDRVYWILFAVAAVCGLVLPLVYLLLSDSGGGTITSQDIGTWKQWWVEHRQAVFAVFYAVVVDPAASVAAAAVPVAPDAAVPAAVIPFRLEKRRVHDAAYIFASGRDRSYSEGRRSR